MKILNIKNTLKKLIVDGRLLTVKQSGFTLIELTIIIGVLAVLVTGVITLLNPISQIQKAEDGKRKSDLDQMRKALELYYHDFGEYPPNAAFSWGNPWQPYIASVPKDPDPAKQYSYITTGQAYYLYASLDRGENDPQACDGGNQCPNAGSASCGGVCNYGISSPNVSP